jgi:hypothetical protein
VGVALFINSFIIPQAKANDFASGNNNEGKRSIVGDAATMVMNFLNESCDGLIELNTTGKSPNGDIPGDSFVRN